MRTQYLSIVVCLILLNSCREHHPERNKIIFKNDLVAVRDSMLEMQQLLWKLPQEDSMPKGLFEFIGNKLYYRNINEKDGIDNRTLLDTDSINLSKLSPFTLAEKHHLYQLANYLKNNFLTEAYYDASLGHWMFTYRNLRNGVIDDDRKICIVDNLDEVRYLAGYDTVLVQQSDLLLLGMKGKVIR